MPKIDKEPITQSQSIMTCTHYGGSILQQLVSHATKVIAVHEVNKYGKPIVGRYSVISVPTIK